MVAQGQGQPASVYTVVERRFADPGEVVVHRWDVVTQPPGGSTEIVATCGTREWAARVRAALEFHDAQTALPGFGGKP